MMTHHDKNILRDLAKKTAEIASMPEQAAKRNLWKSHNMLQKTRPVIFCDPENGWGEIIRVSDLRCVDETARWWEYDLRKQIFWGTNMGDDRVIEPFFNVPLITASSGWGLERVIHGGEEGHAYSWEPMIQNYEEDFRKLHFPEYSVDRQASSQLLNLAHELFDGILHVRQKQSWWWTLGLTSTVIDFRGLENFMYDMYDYPDKLHEVMDFLCNGTLKMLEGFEKNHYLYSNADDSYVGSGGFGYTDELPAPNTDGTCHTKDMWGFCESQETVSISAEMFEEFIFPYQYKILDKFGLNCYGCCEPLDKRWNVVRRFPRLRRVSVSPWCSIPAMAEKLGDKYIYSLKPNPSYLAVDAPDFDLIKKDLKNAIHLAQGCHVEIIMKDNNTIANRPENVTEWCKIAHELAESI